MKLSNILAIVLLTKLFLSSQVRGQVNGEQKPKVHHAEPLFYDLVRDLGAYKGEREANLAFGYTPGRKYEEINILAEYEFAVMDRLAFEVETDFSLFPQKNVGSVMSEHDLEELRLAGQYTFVVSPEKRMSMAVGYAQILSFRSFGKQAPGPAVTELTYSPTFIVAKRLGKRFHSMVITGPLFDQDALQKQHELSWQLNGSAYYELNDPNTLVGMEVNENFSAHESQTVLRPQVKFHMMEHCDVGLLVGVPVHGRNAHNSFFARLIYDI